jgi:hypothetical protein
MANSAALLHRSRLERRQFVTFDVELEQRAIAGRDARR